MLSKKHRNSIKLLLVLILFLYNFFSDSLLLLVLCDLLLRLLLVGRYLHLLIRFNNELLIFHQPFLNLQGFDRNLEGMPLSWSLANQIFYFFMKLLILWLIFSLFCWIFISLMKKICYLFLIEGVFFYFLMKQLDTSWLLINWYQ